MEFDYDDQKLGAGIITLSVLHFIASALVIFSGIVLLCAGQISEVQKELAGLNSEISTGLIVFQFIILRIILIISLILLLKKNKIGVYGYYLFILITIISGIVSSGFNILNIAISLIFPILMGIFISKKKSLFGF